VGARFSAPVQTGPGAHPASCTMVPGLSRGKEQLGRDANPSHPSSAMVKKEYSYTSTTPMDRTASTEPQCLYKGALYLSVYGQDWLLMKCQCICGFLTLEFGSLVVHYMVYAFHLCVCVCVCVCYVATFSVSKYHLEANEYEY